MRSAITFLSIGFPLFLALKFLPLGEFVTCKITGLVT